MDFKWQDFKDLLPFILGFITFVVWLIRLEGVIKAEKAINALRFENIKLRQDASDKNHSELVQEHGKLKDKIVDKLSTIERSLAKIEGRLSINEGQN